MNTIDNIRSRTTEKLIEDAYLKLLNRDISHNVSVTMLCQEVGVNRATFYAHYNDIYDLQAKLETRIAGEIMEIFRDKGLGDNKMTYQRLVAILDYVKTNRQFYLALFQSGRIDNPKTIDLLATRFASDEKSRYKVIFYKAGIAAVIRDWVFNACSDPVDLLASMIAQLYSL